MRDINKVVDSKMKAIQARTSKLHAQLDDAIRSEYRAEHSVSTPTHTPATSGKRRIVRSTVVCSGTASAIGTDMIGMAYRALTGDPTTRCTGRDIQATHIQAWLEDEYCTTVEVADIEAAMKAYRKSAGALVG